MVEASFASLGLHMGPNKKLCRMSLFIFTLCRHVTSYKTLTSLTIVCIKPHVELQQLLKWPCLTSFFTHLEPYYWSISYQGFGSICHWWQVYCMFKHYARWYVGINIKIKRVETQFAPWTNTRSTYLYMYILNPSLPACVKVTKCLHFCLQATINSWILVFLTQNSVVGLIFTKYMSSRKGPFPFGWTGHSLTPYS